MIRADGNGGASETLCPGGSAKGLVEVLQRRGDALLDLIPATYVNFQRAANRVPDVRLIVPQCLIKFAQQKCLLGRLRVKEGDRIDMAMGHAKYEIGLVHLFGGEHPTALLRDVDP